MRTVICISFDVNTLLMDVKADFAIPILLLISFSHLASERELTSQVYKRVHLFQYLAVYTDVACRDL